MSEQVMRGLIQTRLMTLGWSDQTAFEGKSFSPLAGIPYQEVDTVFSESDAITLSGSSLLRGVTRVRLLFPLDQVAANGIGVPWARAEAIKAAFPRKLLMTAAGVKVKISREPKITRSEPQGDRDVTIVDIRFRDR